MGIMSRFVTCERLQLHSHMSSSRPVCKDHSEQERVSPTRVTSVAVAAKPV